MLKVKVPKPFIILKNGRIAIEWYGYSEDETSNLTWNSATKTLVAFTTGIAQQDGFLNIDDAPKNYLGSGWTNCLWGKVTMLWHKH